MRTFVVELGTGTDLHGQDATKAAIRAVRDAFQHVSLPGLRAVAGLTDLDQQMHVEVTLGCPPDAEEIDVERVKAEFPYGTVQIQVVPGGLMARGDAFRPALGDKVDAIVMVNAAIYVKIE
ncbi:MAG: Lin0512 family protein [Chloroflexi bacterium]|nr:Lin0512 family protein [Chloroflexota bacterium]